MLVAGIDSCALFTERAIEKTRRCGAKPQAFSENGSAVLRFNHHAISKRRENSFESA